MKQTLLLFLLSGTTAFAQTPLPNGNFSQWATAANGTDSLVHWSSSNSVVMFPVRSLAKDSISSGHYVAHVITAPFGFAQWTAIGMLVNGSATFSYDGGGGTVAGGVRHVSGGGTPVTFKPTHLTGNYRYETLTAGSGIGEVITTRYNTITQQRDTVGYGFTSFTPQSGYVPFSIALNDRMPGVVPDTVTTIFYSYNRFMVPPMGGWADLFLDDLRLTHSSTRVEEKGRNTAWRVYPNPSTGHLMVQWLTPIPYATTLDICNATGQRVSSLVLPAGKQQQELDMTHVPAGLYFLRTGDGAAQSILISR